MEALIAGYVEKLVAGRKDVTEFVTELISVFLEVLNCKQRKSLRKLIPKAFSSYILTVF